MSTCTAASRRVRIPAKLHKQIKLLELIVISLTFTGVIGITLAVRIVGPDPNPLGWALVTGYVFAMSLLVTALAAVVTVFDKIDYPVSFAFDHWQTYWVCSAAFTTLMIYCITRA